jgi:hypothetical protein
MRAGTIQRVSRDGVLTVWSDDLRKLSFVARWSEQLAGLVGSEVEFEDPYPERQIRRIRLTHPNVVHGVRLEPASES